MRHARNVTLQPIGRFSRSLKARDCLAGLGHHRLLAGDEGEVGDRALGSFLSCAFSPTPMLMTILSRRGIAKSLL